MCSPFLVEQTVQERRHFPFDCGICCMYGRLEKQQQMPIACCNICDGPRLQQGYLVCVSTYVRSTCTGLISWLL